MLPPKIGDGVFGSSSGGVKPTGASFVGASVFSSAMALMERGTYLSGLVAVVIDRDDGCFHGMVARSLELAVERAAGVKREAWVAMAITR